MTPIALAQPAAPKLWITSMSGPGNVANMTDMIEPILSHLDGVIWVLNDCPLNDPGARYLETVKGAGRVIHRQGFARHWAAMNDTLFTGLMEEDDLVLWVDPLERAQLPFVSRIKTEIGPMMAEADVDVVFAWGKPYLFRYRETLEYRNTPHWSLQGWNGRALEWSTIEPDERLVRFNTRPIQRAHIPLHWVGHYARYFVSQPAGSNALALGIEQYTKPGETQSEAFSRREMRRLAFRKEMKRRGYPLTLEGLKDLLSECIDAWLLEHLANEKVLSDLYHLLRGNTAGLKDTHRPQDAIPIP